jgi:uncharacterized membrane protein YqhA
MDPKTDTPLAWLIGRSRLIVVVAVLAVLLSAFSLFLMGAWLSVSTVWETWLDVAVGDVSSTDMIIRFLEIVTVMLKAVFFYLIGVGFYSLFISPLNVTVALGVETLNDLESKIISVIVVIMAVDFLELYIAGGGLDVLYNAAALGIVVAALVFFKIFANRESLEVRRRRDQDLARVEMFERAHEKQDVRRTTELAKDRQKPAK